MPKEEIPNCLVDLQSSIYVVLKLIWGTSKNISVPGPPCTSPWDGAQLSAYFAYSRLGTSATILAPACFLARFLPLPSLLRAPVPQASFLFPVHSKLIPSSGLLLFLVPVLPRDFFLVKAGSSAQSCPLVRPSLTLCVASSGCHYSSTDWVA